MRTALCLSGINKIKNLWTGLLPNAMLAVKDTCFREEQFHHLKSIDFIFKVVQKQFFCQQWEGTMKQSGMRS
jgi:hypothetical protein